MKLFTDKAQNFNFDVELEGASLSGARARLILEFNDKTLLLNGEVDGNGNGSIDIPELPNEAGSSGNATLEVIADKVLFTPWKEPFNVKASKSVRVQNAKVDMKSDKSTFKNISVNVKQKSAPKKVENKKETAEISDRTADIKKWASKFTTFTADKQLKIAKNLKNKAISADSKKKVNEILGANYSKIPKYYSAYLLDKIENGKSQ